MSTEKKIPNNLPVMHRSAKITAKPEAGKRLSGDDPGRFNIALTSEEPVRRWFGNEVLKHGKENIRTARLDEGMVPLLFNHDPNQHIGQVDSYELKDGVLRVSGPFGPSPLAQEKRADYDAGILKGSSGGYRIHKMVRTEDEDNPGAPDQCDITDWEPQDATLTPIPADPTVGAERSEGSTAFPVEIETVLQRSSTPAAPPATAPQPKQETRIMAETVNTPSVAELELARHKDIMAVATDADFRKYVTLDEAQKAIADGTTSAQFRDTVFRKACAANDVSKVGTAGDNIFKSLSEKDQKRFSVLRLVRSLVNEAKPNTFGKKEADAGFEYEVSQELKRGLKIQTEGPLMPSSLSRALGTQTIASAGGQIATTSEAAAVATITRPEVIELLRNRPRIQALGARVLGGLQGVIRLPRQNAANVATWNTEGQAGTATDLGMDFISLTPHRITQQTSWTIELLAETSPDIEGLARQDLDKVRNLALDLAAIAGTGASGQPTGLMLTTGLTLLAPSGTAFADGGQPLTWADVLAYEKTVAAANADSISCGFMFTPEVRAALKNTAKFPAGLAMPVWDDGKKDPDGLEDGPLGYKAGVTNQLAKNGTKGGVTGSILHNSIFGDFSQMILADWGVQEMVVDPYTQALNAAVIVTARSLHDIGIRHVAAFVANPYIAIS